MRLDVQRDSSRTGGPLSSATVNPLLWFDDQWVTRLTVLRDSDPNRAEPDKNCRSSCKHSLALSIALYSFRRRRVGANLSPDNSLHGLASPDELGPPIMTIERQRG